MTNTPSDDDPTVAQPGLGGSDPTATQPATPPPPPPPTSWPAAGGPPSDGTPGSQGSRRNLWIGLGVLGAVVLAVVAFLALGGDDDESDLAAEVAEEREGDDASGDTTDDTVDAGDGESTDGSSNPFEETTSGDLGELDPDNPEAFLADIYKEAFDLSDEQADCLASEMAETFDLEDATAAPDIDELFDVFESCDIDPAELGSGAGG